MSDKHTKNNFKWGSNLFTEEKNKINTLISLMKKVVLVVKITSRIITVARIISVSYTHLDVYKRQTSIFQTTAPFPRTRRTALLAAASDPAYNLSLIHI